MTATTQSGKTLRMWPMSEETDLGGHNWVFDNNILSSSERDPAVRVNAAGREVDREQNDRQRPLEVVPYSS